MPSQLLDLADDLLTVEELSQKLKIGKSSIYNFINKGILPAFKLGKTVRFSRQDIVQALQQSRTKALPKVA
jgi:excisionase family DNA binding protein